MCAAICGNQLSEPHEEAFTRVCVYIVSELRECVYLVGMYPIYVMKMKPVQLLYYALTSAVALVMVTTGVLKLFAADEFRTGMYNAALLPYWTINTLSLSVPWFEITVGASLMSTQLAKGGRHLALVMFLGFLIYAALGLVLHRPYHCACLGKFDIGPWHNHIMWAVLVMGALILLEYISQRKDEPLVGEIK